MKPVQLLGLPIVSGIQTAGVAGTPRTVGRVLEEYQRKREWGPLDSRIMEVPALDGDPGPENKLRYLAGYVKMVEGGRHMFRSLFDPLKFPLIVGGDCGIILVTLPSLTKAYNDLNLLWFDAHGDFNTPKTTPSGFIGGMVLALATGMFQITGLSSEPLIPDRSVALLATRDLDPGEKINIRESRLFHKNYRTGQLASDVASFLNKTDGAVMVHLDVDALDPSIIPAVNFPVANGPSVDEMLQSLFRVKESGRLTAIEVASLDATKDLSGESTRKIAELVIPLLS